MKITVTQEDIDNGVIFNSKLCPVALACLRVIQVNWSELFIMFSEAEIDPFYILPQLRTFMQAFDKGNPVSPFEFEIPWPIQKVSNN